MAGSDRRRSALSPEILLRAYAAGIFPMAESRDDPQLFWVDPEWRGVLPFDQIHIPRRLRRTVRQGSFEVRCDSAFAEVIRACAEAQPNRPESWINEEITALYGELHKRGHAHSVECWHEGTLVGGLYGISLGAAFFGESMFSRATDASKVALVHLLARLKSGGYRLLDTQFITDHLRRFGVIEISRAEYHRRLADALDGKGRFQRDLPEADLDGFLQSITQTS